MPTIKQIADELGVTKPTVTQRLRELDLWDDHVSKSGSAYVVDDMAASAVADALGKTRQKASGSPKGESSGKDAVDAYSVAVEALKSALSASHDQQAALERQLETKDEQIRTLTEQLSAAQETIARISSRTWFDRLFGRGLPPAK